MNMKSKERQNLIVSALFAFALLCLPLTTWAQNQKVNISGGKVTLKSVFSQIEKQTGLSVDYDAEVVNVNKTVTPATTNGAVKNVLQGALRGTGYVCQFADGHIIVKAAASKKAGARVNAGQGNVKKVHGTVKDNKGEALIGVTVADPSNDKRVAITDIDGRYEIETEEGNMLTFSYIGFRTAELKVGKSAILDVKMLDDVANSLNEVVVVGYGVMKKSDLTGTTSQIKPAALTSNVTGNAIEALQGKAAGVAVFNDNSPGSAPSMRIRGSGSISASNEPLYVVDGFPLMDGDISDINPADIESMEILKDASSTAIYGSRGANGVVMITTRGGSKGSKNLNFSSSFGVQMPGRLMDLISGNDFVNFINAAYKNQGSNAPFPEMVPATTNWEKEILENSALLQNYNISFTGNSNGTSYALSGGYYNQDGLIPTQDYEKFSFHTNLNHKFNSWLTVGTSLQYTYAIRNKQDNALGDVPRYGWPTDPTTDENGNHTVADNPFITDAWNPLQDFSNETHRVTTNRVLFNTFAEAQILPNLKYKLSIGQDIKNGRGYDFWTSQTIANQSKNSSGYGSHNWYKNRSKVMENVLSYNNQWDKHRFTATGVYSWQNFVYENLGLSIKDFENDQTGAWDVELGDRNSVDYNSTKYENKLISFTGRVTYAYDDKYLLTATGRWDGSSRFGKNNKWGFFPSVGLAWRMTQEKFMQSLTNVVSDLKLRVSFGITGNQEIGNYKSLPQLLSANYVDGINVLPGYYETIGNPNLKWERTNQWNYGIDLTLWNRINVTFDYYTRDTKDLLYDVPIPSTSGFKSILSNVGEVSNKGWELTIGGNVFRDKDWSIDASVNATYNTNKIKKLYGDVEEVLVGSDGSMGLSRKLMVGKPVDGVYARRSMGIIKTQQQLDDYKARVPGTASTATLGDEMYDDIDGDGSITSNDYICIGSTQPKYFYGINLSVNYKQFGLSVYGQGGFKYASITGSDNNQVSGSVWAMGYANLGNYMLYGENQVNNLTYIPTQYAYDRMWSESNPDGNYPAAGAHNTYLSDRTNGDWSYFMLKNIQLSYDFTSLINMKGIRNLAVNLNFQNFVTFANHRGYNVVNGDISNPWAKSVILGVNIKF